MAELTFPDGYVELADLLLEAAARLQALPLDDEQRSALSRRLRAAADAERHGLQASHERVRALLGDLDALAAGLRIRRPPV